MTAKWVLLCMLWITRREIIIWRTIVIWGCFRHVHGSWSESLIGAQILQYIIINKENLWKNMQLNTTEWSGERSVDTPKTACVTISIAIFKHVNWSKLIKKMSKIKIKFLQRGTTQVLHKYIFHEKLMPCPCHVLTWYKERLVICVVSRHVTKFVW